MKDLTVKELCKLIKEYQVKTNQSLCSIKLFSDSSGAFMDFNKNDVFEFHSIEDLQNKFNKALSGFKYLDEVWYDEMPYNFHSYTADKEGCWIIDKTTRICVRASLVTKRSK